MSETTSTEDLDKRKNLFYRLPGDGDSKKLSREIGVEFASLCGKHFLKLKHLHYGYWTNDLEVDITNLHIAQEKYTDFLLSHVPKNVKTILDVGCGSGHNAKKLIDAGYNVDCVSPSSMLAQQTRNLVGPEYEVYESYYENLLTEKRYDLVLFSESFQYVNMEDAIEKTHQLLNKDGYLLICDIFKNDMEDKCPMSGGHHFSAFNEIISRYPFNLFKDIDITEETAPSIDVENKMFMEVGLPSWNLLNQLLVSRYPLMTKLLRWKYKKKINKLQEKYFSGQRTGETFKKFKSYRLLVYKKVDSA